MNNTILNTFNKGFSKTYLSPAQKDIKELDEKSIYHLSYEHSQFLQSLCKNSELSLFITLTSLASIVIREKIQTSQLVLGTPGYSKNLAEWIPLNLNVNLQNSFKENILAHRQVIIEAYNDSDFQFEELLKELNISTSKNDNGLFDVAVSFDSLHPSIKTNPALSIHIQFFKDEQGIGICFEYSSEQHSKQEVETFFNSITQLCRLASQNINGKIHELKSTTIDADSPLYGPEKEIHFKDSIISEFYAAYSMNPSKDALVFQNQNYSYQWLEEESNKVANDILKHNPKKEDLVAILLPRNEMLLPSLLGVLKSGCAYLPLDPIYPKDRIQYILEDSGASLIIVNNKTKDLFEFSGHKIELESLSDSNTDNTHQPNDIESKDLAYVIYTSGSTGKPKGVALEHGNVVNFFHGMDNELNPTRKSTFLAITTISFDIAVLELLWSCCRGLKVVLQGDQRNSLGLSAKEKQRAKKKLDFSLFFFGNDSKSIPEKYELIKSSVQYADNNGFHSIWTPERHFHEFGGAFPNPALMSTFIASHSKNLKIRAGSVVSPLHNPIRLVEDWAMVDNISNGRAGISFALGWNPRDFVLSDSSFKDRYQRVDADIEFFQKYWKDQKHKVTKDNQEYDLKLFPKPIQKEMPIWMTASNNIETFKLAGEKGLNILTHLLHHSTKELGEKIAAYRESYAKHHGNDKKGIVTVMVHTYVGQEEDQIIDTIKQPFMDYLKSSSRLMKVVLEKTEAAEELANMDISTEDEEAMVESAFHRFYGKSGLFGTPDSCLDMVDTLKEIDVDEVSCLIDFIPNHKEVMGNLENLKELMELANPRENEDIPSQMKMHDVTHFQCTPAMANALISSDEFGESIQNLKYFCIGGEAFPLGVAEKIQKVSDTKILNMYGPTETTVWSSIEKVTQSKKPVFLGNAITNTQFYILDENRNIITDHDAGELCIGGLGVARGYWKRKELTEERFIAHPSNANEKIYRTGDLVRLNKDKQLEFLGRIDRQVKIRGFRIELPEIEMQIMEKCQVEQCVVGLKEIGQSKQLCAYYINNEDLSKNEFTNKLKDVLPDYMIPSFFIKMTEFPKTPNKKVDFNALPLPQANSEEVALGQSPANELEHKLHDIWSEVLEQSTIDVTANFFNLGGDSIQSIQLASKAKNRGIPFNPKDLYKHPTIRGLAQYLSTSISTSISYEKAEGTVSLTPIQNWFFQIPQANLNHWNQSIALDMDNNTDTHILEKAINTVASQNSNFNLRYKWIGEKEWEQSFESPHPTISIQRMSNEESKDHFIDQLHSSLDLEHGPVLACGLVDTEEEQQLIITIHHLIVDGISWRILTEEVEKQYFSLLDSQTTIVKEDVASLKDWTSYLNDLQQSEVYAQDSQYWKESVQRYKNYTVVPLSKEPSFTEQDSLVLTFETPLCNADTASTKASTEEKLLTAFLQTLSTATQHFQFAVDLESHGREILLNQYKDYNFNETMGWFTAKYPVGIEVDNDIHHTLKNAIQSMQAIPNNGITYGLWKETEEENFTPSIIFNYLGNTENSIKNSKLFKGLSLSPGQVRSNQANRHHAIEVNIVENASSLQWELILEKQFWSDLSNDLVESIQNNMELIKNLTPQLEDFPYASINSKQFQQLMEFNPKLSNILPLSSLQKPMYYMTQLGEGSQTDFQTYTHQAKIYLQGKLDVDMFKEAWNETLNRHDLPKSTFTQVGQQPLILTHKEQFFPLKYLDLSKDNPETAKKKLQIIIKKDYLQSFKMDKAPYIRLTLIQTEEDKYCFIFSYHHILMDGWSLQVLISEFKNIYSNKLQDQTPDMDSAPSFESYIQWATSTQEEDIQSYWKNYLDGFHGLPTLHSKKKSQNNLQIRNFKTIEGHFDERQITALTNTSKSLGVTSSTVIQYAWGLTLKELTGQSDVVFGCTISGRPSNVPGIDGLVGFLINGVPIRIPFDQQENQSLKETLEHFQATTLQSQDYGYISPSEIHKTTSLDINTPLYQSVLVYQNFPMKDLHGTRIGDMVVDKVDFLERNPLPLSIKITPGEGYHWAFDYDTNLFEQNEIQKISNQFFACLSELIHQDTHENK